MANGFKTVTGFISISGLHCLPIWLYYLPDLHRFHLLDQIYNQYLLNGILACLVFGRALCLYTEVRCLHF